MTATLVFETARNLLPLRRRRLGTTACLALLSLIGVAQARQAASALVQLASAAVKATTADATAGDAAATTAPKPSSSPAAASPATVVTHRPRSASSA